MSERLIEVDPKSHVEGATWSRGRAARRVAGYVFGVQGAMTIYFVVAVFLRLKPVTLVQLGFYAASDSVLIAVALAWGVLGAVWLVLGVMVVRESRFATRWIVLVAAANLVAFGATIANRPTCPWPVQRLWVEGCIAFSHDYPKSLLVYVGVLLFLPSAALVALIYGIARGRLRSSEGTAVPGPLLRNERL